MRTFCIWKTVMTCEVYGCYHEKGPQICKKVAIWPGTDRESSRWFWQKTLVNQFFWQRPAPEIFYLMEPPERDRPDVNG